jgi:hypothetical protein
MLRSADKEKKEEREQHKILKTRQAFKRERDDAGEGHCNLLYAGNQF